MKVKTIEAPNTKTYEDKLNEAVKEIKQQGYEVLAVDSKVLNDKLVAVISYGHRAKLNS